MSLSLSRSLTASIEEAYETAMKRYPLRKEEAERWIGSASGDEGICLKFLYAFMPLADIVSYEVSVIASYVKATLDMYETVSYARQVPEELFLSYVLSCRVNNENLDGSRGWLYSEIAPRVQGKTMTEAALEVNYWCYEKATYTPTDGRTIAPLGMCRRAMGRCGEESTLAVSALRSVGIPARQCYVPRWAHCDDNHAWVEVWADGAWHYLGACEPEPVLDKGWFTAAASKAMLVHAKAYSHFLNGEKMAKQTPLYSLINSTETYGTCHTVHVTVTDRGLPLEKVRVSFQLINYSELFELYAEETNSEGKASFLTGFGDLYICAEAKGKFLGIRVDTRLGTEITLEMEKGICPGELADEPEERFDLNPPLEVIPMSQPADQKSVHEARLKECEQIREAYEASFVKESGISADWDGYFAMAKGNHGEIRRFYEAEEFSREDKELLLETLREKDFADCTAEILISFLKNALPHKEKWPTQVYQSYLLAPRIGNEMLEDCRGRILELLSERGLLEGEGALDTAEKVWAYLEEALTMIDEQGAGGGSPAVEGCLRFGVCTEQALPVVFVQICRALGIPARQNPVTREPEAVVLKGGKTVFVPVKKQARKGDGQPVTLTLNNRSGRPLEYMLHFTVGRYEGGRYHTLNYWGTKLEEKVSLQVPAGSYRLITTVRQIDGGVSAYMKYFMLKEDRSLELELREDKTAEKLKYTELPRGEVRVIDRQNGSIEAPTDIRSLYQGRKTILILAEPGKEPTEHLLQEILECREAYCREGYLLLAALSDLSGMKNETWMRVLDCGIDVIPVLCTDDEYIHAMHEAYHVGDERLPFAAAINKEGKGLFAFANYNIRTAWTLMDLFRAEAETESAVR